MPIYQRKEGTYQVRLMRRGVKLSKTFPTRSQAEQWEALQLRGIYAGEVNAVNPTKTLRDVLDRYAADVAPKHKGYKWEMTRCSKLAKDDIADVPLPDLRPALFAKWRDDQIAAGYSPYTVNREITIISAAIEHARKELSWLADNPIKGRVSRAKEPQERTRTVTADEVAKIKAVALYDPDAPPATMKQRTACVMLFALETGMRAGEICGLTWDCVNIADRTAHLPDTKNGYPRTVPLSPEAMRLVEQCRPLNSRTVFGIASGTLDAIFRSLKGQAGIVDMHFHDTRRTAASWMAKVYDAPTLAKILGHRDMNETINTYYAPNMRAEAELLAQHRKPSAPEVAKEEPPPGDVIPVADPRSLRWYASQCRPGEMAIAAIYGGRLIELRYLDEFLSGDIADDQQAVKAALEGVKSVIDADPVSAWYLVTTEPTALMSPVVIDADPRIILKSEMRFLARTKHASN